MRPIFFQVHIFKPLQELVGRTRIRGTRSMSRETRQWGWSSTTSQITMDSPTSLFQTQRLRSSLSALMEQQSTNTHEVKASISTNDITKFFSCFKFQYTQGKQQSESILNLNSCFKILHKGASPPVTLPPATDPSRPLGKYYY